MKQAWDAVKHLRIGEERARRQRAAAASGVQLSLLQGGGNRQRLRCLYLHTRCQPALPRRQHSGCRGSQKTYAGCSREAHAGRRLPRDVSRPKQGLHRGSDWAAEGVRGATQAEGSHGLAGPPDAM